MHRQIAIITLGLVAVAGLNAGQIQIGGNNGLTAGTVTATSTAVGGSQGEQTWAGDIAGGTTLGGTLPSGLFTTNGVTFAMINDSGANAGSNLWISNNQAGTATLTIPMGIFGVTDVWTMLNDQYGTVGGTNTQVQFNFGTTSSVANLAPLLFTLGNGTTISDAADCLTGTCPNYATTLDQVNSYGPTGTLNPVSGPKVSAWQVFSGTYTGGNGAYAGTSGNAYLDAQGFSLGSAYQGQYLVSVQVIDTTTATRQSRDMLSAITVNAVPEPSTWMLFAGGIAILGFTRLRRKSVV